MMTLCAFVVTVLAIIGIARYNESEKLFWQLFIAFCGSYAAATAVYNFVDDKKDDKVVVIDKVPTQVLSDVPTFNGLVTGMSFSASKRSKSAKPVSKDSLISQTNNIIVSKVHARMRGQPTWRMFFDDG